MLKVESVVQLLIDEAVTPVTAGGPYEKTSIWGTHLKGQDSRNHAQLEHSGHYVKHERLHHELNGARPAVQHTCKRTRASREMEAEVK